LDEQYDYGLDEGESFEPLDDPDDDIDVSLPHIMTLLGPIDPGALGIALHHEHIFNHTNPLAATDDDLIIDDIVASAADVELFFGAGGRALVDMGPVDYGRSITDLLVIAAHSPVHILVTTGHHKRLIAAPFVGDDSVDAITGRNIRDIRDGIDGTTARAALVKAGTSLNEITDIEQRVLKAAAVTQIKTGVPISTHTELGTMALEQMTVLTAAGADPARVILGHLDAQIADRRYLIAVLQTGAFVSFDRWTRFDMAPDELRASVLHELASAGYLDQLLISGDFARKSNHLGYGGQFGFDYMLDRVPLMLMDAGFDAPSVRQLLVENPARALTIHPPTA